MIIKNTDTLNQTTRPYKPVPHPMQHRITEFRKIPSQWCGITYHTIAELEQKLVEQNRFESF